MLKLLSTKIKEISQEFTLLSSEYLVNDSKGYNLKQTLINLKFLKYVYLLFSFVIVRSKNQSISVKQQNLPGCSNSIQSSHFQANQPNQLIFIQQLSNSKSLKIPKTQEIENTETEKSYNATDNNVIADIALENDDNSQERTVVTKSDIQATGNIGQ